MKQYPTIRAFLAEAINGHHTPDEIIEILDAIELGIALQDRDRALAEQFEVMPPNDLGDPVYCRGYEAGYKAGFDEGLLFREEEPKDEAN